MRVWRPLRSYGPLISLLLAPVAWIAAAVLASRVFPIYWASFWLALSVVVLFVAGVVLLYWSFAFLTLRYVFDRNGLVLYWGGSQQTIPMNRVTAISRWSEGEEVRERGLRWPGCHRGRARLAGGGRVEFYATAGRPAQVVVRTEEGAFALSPRDPDEFIREVEVRRSLGITRQLAQERHSWWLLGWSIWQDRLVWIVGGLGLVANLALFALLCYWYPVLLATRPLLPLHYSEVMEESQVRIIPDIIGPAADLFKLPAFGLALLGGNFFLGLLLHRHHRLLVLLLIAVTLVVQVMFLLGATYILYR